MAKHIIKGNNWKKPKDQKQQTRTNRINYLLPFLCAVFASFCIANGILLGDSMNASSVGSPSDISGGETEPGGDVTEPSGDVTDPTEDVTDPTGGDTDPTGGETDPGEGEKEKEKEEEQEEKKEEEKKEEEKKEEEKKDDGEEKEEEKKEEEKKTDTYKIASKIENTELDGKGEVADSAKYTAILKPAEGYLLPTSITVVMGEDETELKNFTYDPVTGKIEIPENVIKGDLTLNGTAEPIQYYSVTSKISNGILYGSTADTKDGYSATIVPNAGFSVPLKITATAEDEEFTDFTYNATTGEIKVKPSAMTGNLSFMGDCVIAIQAEKYQVVTSIGCGKAEIRKDSTASVLEIRIVPDEGYSCPENLIVISGNKRFTDYTYDPLTGVLTIGSGKVSRVIISGVCTDKSTEIKYLGERSAVPKTEENPTEVKKKK